jgi:hypothetical protein
VQDVHERTAAVLEALHSDDRTDYAGELARPYHRSENAQKAVEYLTLVSEKATARSALAEATGYLMMSGLQPVSLLPSTRERDQRELRLQLALAVVQSATGGWRAAERFQSLERAQGGPGQKPQEDARRAAQCAAALPGRRKNF